MFSAASRFRQAVSSADLLPARSQDFTYRSGLNLFNGGPTLLINVRALARSISTAFFLSVIIIFMVLKALSHSAVETGIKLTARRRGFKSLGGIPVSTYS
jgi:hypothetical protein